MADAQNNSVDRVEFVYKTTIGGVVVVCSRVDDTIFAEVLGQELIVRITIKCSLKNFHPGVPKPAPEFFHYFSEGTEVLEDEIEVAEPAFDRLKEGDAWTVTPDSCRSCLGRTIDLVIPDQAGEVIDPEDVRLTFEAFEPAPPPRKVIGAMDVPSIKRVSPQLPCLPELVRGYARNQARLSGRCGRPRRQTHARDARPGGC